MQHPPIIHAVDLYVVYRRWITCRDHSASLVYMPFIERFSKNWAQRTCEVNNERRILHVVTQLYAIINPPLQVPSIGTAILASVDVQVLLLLSNIQYIHVCVWKTLKITVLWDVTLWNLVDMYRRFRGSCCLHHHGWWMHHARYQNIWFLLFYFKCTI
jgi:hypothetical protein